MLSYATATEAERPEMYRQRLEAERQAQREHVRLEIVRMIVGANMGITMTTEELVTSAKAIEAFVTGPQTGNSASSRLAQVDGISADVRRRSDLLAAAKAIEDGLAAAGISLIDEPNGGTSWQQRDAPARGFVSRDYGAGRA